MAQYKKLRKQANRHATPKQPPLAIMLSVIAVAVIALIGFILISQNTASSAQANVPADVKGAPHLVVDQDSIDLGDIALGRTVETQFKVRNTGDQDLIITNKPHVQVVQGCCPPPVNLSTSVIKPGQEATVSLSFSMMVMDGSSMGGKHHFNIDLQTNDPQNPVKQLVVLSNWI